MRIFGVDAVQHPRIVQRYINRVSVEASFFKKMSSMENLLFGAKLYGITDSESKPRIREILRQTSASSTTASASRWSISPAACSRRSPWRERC